MKEFMGLREFLLLKYTIDTYPPRPVYNGELLPSKDWRDFGGDLVRRYDYAKASWEKYGEEGPPIGSKVMTLQGGHGGGVWVQRIFEGIYDRDSRFFSISRIENGQKQISIVERDVWWAIIMVVEG